MLVHPEVYAFLNRQNRTELEEKKNKPLITRGGQINQGGPEKARRAVEYEGDREPEERADEVEYLNERKSSLNFYA